MNELMNFDPATGWSKPYPSHAAQWREHNGKTAWLFNPWTGERRTAPDVGSDPFGLLIHSGDAALSAQSGAQVIRALKTQADKDGGDCAKGGEYEDLLALMERAAREAGGSQWVAEGFESRTLGAAFYGGLIMNADGETVVAQCVNESNASHMMSSSPANVLWLIRQYRAALSPTQPTEQGER